MTEKLIRDLLDQRIPADQLRIERDPVRLEAALVDKFGEESRELAASRFADVSEYGDVFEVLYALAARRGITPAMIESARVAKLKAKGGFDRGLIYLPNGVADR